MAKLAKLNSCKISEVEFVTKTKLNQWKSSKGLSINYTNFRNP